MPWFIKVRQETSWRVARPDRVEWDISSDQIWILLEGVPEKVSAKDQALEKALQAWKELKGRENLTPGTKTLEGPSGEPRRTFSKPILLLVLFEKRLDWLKR